ncbi:phosphoserine phosphatase SerB [Vespertiliibacter pulmonis]|uniref:Phosphoserine phosphatase n=1 Tax=Vespertiliibacter pulmonis TaxID=1443036 RepID=A0A3N4VNI4_9PAST|nr:phosphoserine phosphatase SerB [Vespertiliibacter pulmonis]QLB20496.1 phosphoserine phosphatase SerB [Vespertiliibacter pulmonis]RPE80801.1 phosphoserine phosphatase [Vespertiliibacter pulmonis]
MPFFIYSKTLSTEKITEFQQQNALNLLGICCYLDYQIAFFDQPLTENIKQNASLMACDISDLDIIPDLEQMGLLVMDMDSTAIKIECIDEIAKLAGTGEMVSTITASAMQGELDFEQSLRKRVATLKDAPEIILQKVRDSLPLMDGFEQMVEILQSKGWKLAIASGGFNYFADYLQQKYKLDAAVSNQLEIINGKLTGKVKGSIVDAIYKAESLKQLAEQYEIPQNQWVAVGDGANDLVMLQVASLGVALHAKPKVQAQAKNVVNFGDLTALIVLLNAKNLFMELEGK